VLGAGFPHFVHRLVRTEPVEGSLRGGVHFGNIVPNSMYILGEERRPRSLISFELVFSPLSFTGHITFGVLFFSTPLGYLLPLHVTTVSGADLIHVYDILQRLVGVPPCGSCDIFNARNGNVAHRYTGGPIVSIKTAIPFELEALGIGPSATRTVERIAGTLFRRELLLIR
jgi:hypothetical protein